MAASRGFRDWPLGSKLSLVTTAVSGTALVLACAVFLVHDWTSTRREASRELAGLANLLAEQSSVALALQFRTEAEAVLHSLSAVEDVSWAALYDAKPSVFARFSREGEGPAAETPGPDGVHLEAGRLRVAVPVLQEKRRIGTLVLEASMASARTRLALGIAVTGLVLAGSTLIAFALAVRLGRPILDPIVSLAGTIETVARERRYDLRARESAGTDEIGRVIRGFNSMLGTIQDRDAALARMASILEATPDFVGMADPEGRVLYVNRAGRRMAGRGEAEDLGSLRIADFHPAGAYEVIRDAGIPAALREGHWQGESVLKHRDGTLIPALQVILVHRGSGGEVAFISTIVRDLREMKGAEEALRRSEEQLRQSQKMEALGRLAGGVAHDFNNLLTVMGGYAHLMMSQLPHDHALASQARAVADAVDRAGTLTRQLLAFSRRQVIRPEVLDLNSLVHESEKMLRRLIGENITFETRYDALPGHVRGDAGQIDQILMNLVVNARDAMPRGGRLEVSTARRRVGAAEAPTIGLPGPGDYVTLSVKDDGTGMEAALLPHIFEPFFTTKETGKGTGLGLSTVYGIVSQAGGGIQISSTPGKGSEFTVYLPAAEEVPAKAPPAPADGLPATRAGGTILLAEDERGVRGFIRESLELAGYQVIEARSGSEALQLLDRWNGPIDLVVSDVIMPGLSGPELVRRARERRPSLPVLLISGYPEDELGAGSAPDPGTDFIGKPFTPAALAARVRSILDRNTGAP